MVKFYDFFVFTSVLSYLFPFIFSLIKLQRGIRNDELRIVLFIALTSFLSEVCSFCFIYFFGFSNNSIVQIYTMFMVVYIYLYYRNTVFLKNKKLHELIVLMMFIFMIFFFFKNLGNSKINVISNLCLTLYGVLLASIYFYKVYTEMKIANLFQDGLFWVNSAFLIYFSSTFYVSLFEDYIRSEDSNLLYYTWPIQLVSTIIFNVILSRGIWLMRKQ